MKTAVFVTVSLILLLFNSCHKQTDKFFYALDNHMIAGQKQGEGIHYTDIEPDINCAVEDPFIRTDTTINIDLDHDGTFDFSLTKTICHPSMLGQDCDQATISPLNDNAVCINLTTNWLDTLSLHDSITTSSDWSYTTTLVYSYLWEFIGDQTTIKGYWQDAIQPNKNYIGVMLQKNNKQYFGWIGMKSVPLFRQYNFIITDYAITEVYEKK